MPRRMTGRRSQRAAAACLRNLGGGASGGPHPTSTPPLEPHAQLGTAALPCQTQILLTSRRAYARHQLLLRAHDLSCRHAGGRVAKGLGGGVAAADVRAAKAAGQRPVDALLMQRQQQRQQLSVQACGQAGGGGGHARGAGGARPRPQHGPTHLLIVGVPAAKAAAVPADA